MKTLPKLRLARAERDRLHWRLVVIGLVLLFLHGTAGIAVAAVVAEGPSDASVLGRSSCAPTSLAHFAVSQRRRPAPQLASRIAKASTIAICECEGNDVLLHVVTKRAMCEKGAFVGEMLNASILVKPVNLAEVLVSFIGRAMIHSKI